MRHSRREQVILVLRTLPSGQHCTVRLPEDDCLELGLLDTYQDLKDVLYGAGSAQAARFVRGVPPRSMRASQRSLILTRPAPRGWDRKTLQTTFRIGSKTTMLDLAELLHFVQVDWHHAKGPDGSRHVRSWWEGLYQSGDIRRHRAAMARGARAASSRHPAPALALAI